MWAAWRILSLHIPRTLSKLALLGIYYLSPTFVSDRILLIISLLLKSASVTGELSITNIARMNRDYFTAKLLKSEE